ncbi:MAG: UDP-N-acetylmuramoyl-L-alanyl-D-glutamate--2,6-diaminopimelate ligase [Bacteroidales bacterium]|jgi:UDP-N-acetylmuramoyl-L-alanyl-D-glutamate--2,6-diaminopimelate ligase|nr:UDP-N-acetylmuramoyl-L-alanyl-D-glutamate--2,6-diaminopimelate ligase [Bacteroidales bacterium]
MTSIENILNNISVISVTGDTSVVISSVEFDSRKVTEGSMFVAVKGINADGHQFINQSVAAGASAVLCEQIPENPSCEVCWITVNNSAKALGEVASNFYNNPSLNFNLVGVTGTNGKTTVATSLYNMFMKLGYKCGLFSTVCNYINGRKLATTYTTPDPLYLNKTLADMEAEGCDYVFMEVSSHSADQQRIAGLRFAGAIFTNLTHDHLDYHKTFDNYLAAKKSFFDSLTPSAFALVNIDDRNGRIMLQNCKASHHTFSIRTMADFRCSILECGFSGMCIKINGEEVWVKFIGDFNASNLLAVYASSVLLGAESREALTVISNLNPVSGRLEAVEGNSEISGIVDYAHTPDALSNVIETIKRLRQGNAKLITVVGAGGDRDKTKRPKMALISAQGSDKLILTSDNPRNESPEAILDDMESGITADLKKKTLRITDRKEAIRAAVMLAGKGDVILVAGKGHETYQDIKGVKYHFDDKEELIKALETKK